MIKLVYIFKILLSHSIYNKKLLIFLLLEQKAMKMYHDFIINNSLNDSYKALIR